MKRQTRKLVFETNSSSTHSITVCKTGEYDTLNYRDLDNNVVSEFGEFGWGYEEYTDAETKLSYLLTMIIETNSYCKSVEEFYDLDDFKEVEYAVKNITGANGLIIESNIKPSSYNAEWNNHDGYVDHQSVEDIHDLMNYYGCSIEEFIFDTGITLVIDNDNHW